MSEYQYYEFTAIDRPLTREEMAELRSRSSRATITPTSFVNEYNFGNLKGDPADWMRRYFDAFVYTANWRSCRLALRVPHGVFRKSELKAFETDESLRIDDAGSHWIIDWSLNESEYYERFDMEAGSGWMGRLLPLRDELLRGDLRPLYLGWLAGVSGGEIDDEALEPEAPPGMAQLSAAQQALAEFLKINQDLLAAAATGSPAPAASSDDSIDTWLMLLSANEMRNTLKLLLRNQSQYAERQIKTRFLAWQRENAQGAAPTRAQRRVSELWALAGEAERLRLETEAKEAALQEAENRKKRAVYLATLAADFDRCWNAIDRHAQCAVASGYDDATRAIVDLADAYELVSKRSAFDQALHRFMERHGKRRALVNRLVDAGLWCK